MSHLFFKFKQYKNANIANFVYYRKTGKSILELCNCYGCKYVKLYRFSRFSVSRQ